MTGSDLVEKWIEEQLQEGKTPEQLAGQMFVSGNTVYKIGKPNKKGQFNLKIYCGAVDLLTYEMGLGI